VEIRGGTHPRHLPVADGRRACLRSPRQCKETKTADSGMRVEFSGMPLRMHLAITALVTTWHFSGRNPTQILGIVLGIKPGRCKTAMKDVPRRYDPRQSWQETQGQKAFNWEQGRVFIAIGVEAGSDYRDSCLVPAVRSSAPILGTGDRGPHAVRGLHREHQAGHGLGQDPSDIMNQAGIAPTEL
jgi:hypothetical protein